VEVDLRVIVQEVADGSALVSREVVEDDVNLLPPRLRLDDVAKESKELLTGVSSDRLAEDLTTAGIQGGIERQRAEAVVLEAVPLGPSRRQRQDRIQSIECLDVGLLVQAEDGRVPRRVQVQANDVRGLALEVGIVRRHVAFQPMRLESRPCPHTRDHHVADAEFGAELARAPVRRAVLRRRTGLLQDLGFQCRGPHPRLTTHVTRVEPADPAFLEAPLPAGDVGRAAAQSLLHLGVGAPLVEHQDQTRPLNHLRARAAQAGELLELPSLCRCNAEALMSHSFKYTTDSAVTGH